jgi:kumamolisin
LYAQAASAGLFHDITSGNNDIYGKLGGEFAAEVGWDACTGLGSMDGAKLLALLAGQQPAKAKAAAAAR